MWVVSYIDGNEPVNLDHFERFWKSDMDSNGYTSIKGSFIVFKSKKYMESHEIKWQYNNSKDRDHEYNQLLKLCHQLTVREY